MKKQLLLFLVLAVSISLSFNSAKAALTVTVATVTTSTGASGLAASPIYPQNGVVIYGLKVTASGGSTTVSQIVMPGTYTSGLQTLFSNAQLFHSSNSSYDNTAQLIAGATLSATTASVGSTSITFSGFSDVVSTQEYYYLMVDYTYTGTATNITNQFQNPVVTCTSVTPTVTSNAKSPSYALKPVTVSLATVTTNNNSNGLAASPLYPQSNPVTLYGVGITNTGGAPVVSEVDIASTNNTSLSTYFSNAVLYKSANSSFDASASPIAGTGVTGTNVTVTNGTIAFTGLSQTLSSAAPVYYYLVVKYGYTGSTASSVTFSSMTLTYAGGNTTSKSTNSPAYTLNPATLTMARVTNTAGNNGLSASNLYSPQSAAVVYGFSAISAGGSTLTVNSFAIGSTNNNSLSTNFSNARLYQSSNSSYDNSAQPIAGSGVSGTMAAFNNGVVTFTGISQAITTSTTQYYYLVMDYANTGTSSGNSTTFSTITATLSSNSTTSATSAGPGYTLNPTTVNLASVNGNANSNGLSANPVNPQATPVILYGVKATTTGGLPVVNEVDIASNNNSLSTYFSAAKLYSSTNSSYDNSASPIAGAGVSGTNVAFNNGIIAFTGLSQTLSSATPVYYYLVLTYNNTAGAASSVIFNNTTLVYAAGNKTSTATSGPNYTLNPPTATVTLSGNNTVGSNNNGITATGIAFGQTGIVMFGFSVAVANAPATLNTITLNASMGNNTIGSYFSQASFKLYSCSNTNYTTGTLKQITSANFGLNNNVVTISGLTEAMTASQTNNYFIVADYNTAGSLSSSAQLTLPNNGITYTTGGSSTNTLSGTPISGVTFTMAQPTVTFTGINNIGTGSGGNGITPTSLTYGQTGVVLYGFSLTDSGSPTTVNQVNLSTNNPVVQFFTNIKIYSSPTSTFNQSTATLMSTTTSPSSGNSAFNITGISEALALNQTKYYFIMGDYNNVGNTLPSTMKFDFSDMFTTNSNFTKSTSNTTGQTFSLASPVLTVSNYTNGVYTGTGIAGGATYTLLGFTLSYSGPTNMHELGLDLNFPSGGGGFTSGYIASVDVVDASTGTRPSYITAVNNNGNNIKIEFDGSARSTTTNYLLKVTFNNNFSVHPVPPFSVCLNSSSNIASNVCQNNSNCTIVNNYNVASTGSSCSNTYQTQNIYDWVGSTLSNGTDWNTAANWSPATVPGTADLARIGVNNGFNALPILATNSLTGSTTTNVGAIQFGSTTSGSFTTLGVTVNSGFTLKVNGDITMQSDAQSFRGYPVNLAGNGTILAADINILTSNTAATHAIQATMNASVNTLTLSGNVVLSTDATSSSIAYNSTFNLTSGTMTAANITSTNNSANSVSSFIIAPAPTATLQLTGTTALSGLSATGKNIITFNTAGTTVQYSGAAQTVYTSAAITGLATGPSYNNLVFSGTGVKTSNNGTLNISGDFTNTLTNDASNNAVLTGSPVVFGGNTAETLKGGSGNGTTFGNVTFSSGGTKTMSSGVFGVSSTGILTMSGSTTLAAGSNILTLKSDASGSASVATIPSGAKITGTVNVQRYVAGGAGRRAYRLASSPVNQGTLTDSTGTTPAYGFTDLQATTPITGGNIKGTYTVAQPAGFDPSPTGNPSILFYYEPNADPTSAAIAVSEYKGISSINDMLPSGNGFLFFFRGTRDSVDASGNSKLSTAAVAENTTLNFNGALTQGNITVYIPTDTIAATNGLYVTPTKAYGLSNKFSYTVSKPTASSTDGLHLLGNPYACTIDLDAMAGNMTNLTNNYVYMMNGTGTFGAYTIGSGSTALNNGVGRFVLPGEGFFITVNSAKATAQFTESVKVTNVASGSVPTSFAIEKQPSLATTGNNNSPAKLSIAPGTTPQLLKVNLTLDSLHANETIIQFAQNSSVKNKYDKHEDAYYAYGLSQTTFMASYTSDNKLCLVNQMGSLDSIKAIPLYVQGTTNGLYTITVSGASSVDPRYKLYLKDNFMKDSLDLSANSTYKFNINTSNTQTYGGSRFALVVVPNNIASYYNLLSFTGAKETAGVQLNWKTQYEGTYTTFTVQRSTDNGITFSDLGSVQSDASGSYSFIDAKPVTDITNNYRLKQNNIDNLNSYSKIVPISYQPIISVTDKLSLYPNPTVSVIKMDIKDASTSSVQIRIFDMVGNLMMNSNVSGGSTVSQDVSRLQKGTYIIQVTGSGNKNYGVGKFTKL